MVPERGQTHDQVHSKVCRLVFQAQLVAVQHGLHALGLETLLNHFVDGVVNGGQDGLSVGGLDVLQPHGEVGVPGVVLVPGHRAEVGPQPAVDQSFVERGAGAARQQLRRHLQREGGVQVQDVRLQPAHRHRRLPRRVRVHRVRRAADVLAAGRGPARLRGHGGVHADGGELAEVLLVYEAQRGGQVQVAVAEHPGVGGVVVLGVELLQLLPGQLRDVQREPAAGVAVRVTWVQIV